MLPGRGFGLRSSRTQTARLASSGGGCMDRRGLQIDGFLLSAVAAEIRSELGGAKIDKVYSASRDSIVISAGRGRARRLLASAAQSAARVCLTSAPPASLPEPTLFAMLLRKHLTGGRIVSVRQLELDRVLTIQVQGWADVDPSENKLLIMEITGRLSNIILTDMEGRILDAMRRVDQSRNRYRELLPGAVYMPPPPMDKTDPRNGLTREAFIAAIRRRAAQDRARERLHARGVSEALAQCFAGIGPTLGAELAFAAGLDRAESATEPSDAQLTSLWEAFSAFLDGARNGRFVFEAAFERADERAQAMSCGGLSHLADDEARLCIERFTSASDMIDTCFARSEQLEQLEERRRALGREVGALLERGRRKLEAQRAELAAASRSDCLRRQGELLTANLHLFGNGPLRAKRVRAVDYFDPAMAQVEVEVDPSLSASANAQVLFARYARAQRALRAIADNIAAAEDDNAYLESVTSMIETADGIEHLDSIEEELAALGYMRPDRRHRQGALSVAPNPGRKDRARQAGRAERNPRAHPHLPTSYTARSGHEILVGRNNLENDHLTLKLARGHDLWFHAKDVHGSHVVLKRRAAEDVPDETVRAAALLAAYYSRARMSSNIAVDCTEVKNVRKPRGARPGMVIYDHHRTVWVTPSRKEIAATFGLNGAVLDRAHD